MTTTETPIMVTPRERFNIVDQHPMWNDYPSDDDDIHNTSETVHQPLTLADLDVSDIDDDMCMSELNVPDYTSDTEGIVGLNRIFDEETETPNVEEAINNEDIEMIHIITDTDEFEDQYEDDQNEDEYEDEEEYGQRENDAWLEDDADFIEFQNMQRVMTDNETITKPVWRYRKEIMEYDMFKCTCNNNANSDIYEGDPATECTEHCFQEPEGLFALAIMNSILGHTYCRHNNQTKAENVYELSIAISPDNSPCYLDYAQIQETCHDDYFKAEQAYVKSIEIHHNVLAMYNLAGMHLRRFNDGDGDTICLHKAIMYYGRACDYGDSASSYMAALLLYKNYDYPDKIEEFAYRLSRLANDKDKHTEVNRAYENLLEDIGVINIYERLKTAPQQKYTTQCLMHISSHRHVSPYITKVALFTKLNHFTECGICYQEDKLNIDLQCGHTTCTDCYKRVYLNECPFCRFSFK